MNPLAGRTDREAWRAKYHGHKESSMTERLNYKWNRTGHADGNEPVEREEVGKYKERIQQGP